MRELYIYYRVASGSAELARSRALAMQQQLCARHPGLRARLLRRPEESGGQQTWMETYAADPLLAPGGVDAALQAAIAAAAAEWHALIHGERHCEAFEPCAS